MISQSVKAPKESRKIIAYHEIQRDKLNSVMREGVLGTQTSDKDTDVITKTNVFLDGFRLPHQINANLSRTSVIFAYIAQGDKAIDITSGKLVDAAIIPDDKHMLITICAPADKCYVSDLDAFDEVKDYLQRDDIAKAEIHARKYWNNLYPYDAPDSLKIKRPELIITCDIPPTDINPD